MNKKSHILHQRNTRLSPGMIFIRAPFMYIAIHSGAVPILITPSTASKSGASIWKSRDPEISDGFFGFLGNKVPGNWEISRISWLFLNPAFPEMPRNQEKIMPQLVLQVAHPNYEQTFHPTNLLILIFPCVSAQKATRRHTAYTFWSLVLVLSVAHANP